MRYCFLRDDDCHWYMIPVEKAKLFSQLLVNSLENDDYCDFCNEFGEYCIDSPQHYTFEDPEEV